MRKIKIFLASSITDLKVDRLEVGDFIRQLNDIYFDRGVQFFLGKCEDFDNAISAEGKQSEFDREIRDSELCFFLFFKKVGDYTRHEFEVALDAFKTCKKPKIVTYFKYVNSPEEATDEVKAFMQKLDGEIKHYYNIYQNIDTLKLGILMQIKLMGLDAEEPKVENGKVVFGGTAVADTAALPVFAGNRTLGELKEKFQTITARYYALREKLMSDLEDGAAEEEYRKVAAERAQTEEEIRSAEKTVLEAVKSMAERTAMGDLSPRQIAAYRAFERGAYGEALEILDLNEILTDLSHDREMSDGYLARMQVNVNELLQRVEVLRAGGVDKDKAAEIGNIYETVTELIRTYSSLNKTPLYGYAKFLYDQNDHAKAIEIAKQLEYFYSDPRSSASEVSRAALYDLLGTLYSVTQRHAEAEAAYRHALEIHAELARTDPAAEPALAGNYNNLGTFYLETQRYAKAEEMHEKALEIRVRLAQYDPVTFAPELAASYNDLGVLYRKTRRYAKAEEMYKHALAIYVRLSKNDPSFEPNLARICNNLGDLYDETQRQEEAEDAFKRALEIQERLAQKNPAAYEPDLSGSYNNLGTLYGDMQRYAEAEEMHRHALEIRERLARTDPAVFEPQLAASYHNLGTLYDDMQRQEDSEEAYKHAIAIYERLVQTAPAAFEAYLAGSYHDLGVLYWRMRRYAAAERAHVSAIKIRVRLAKADPAVFDTELATSYNDLGMLYVDVQRYEAAEKVYKCAVNLCERLSRYDPAAYEPQLAGSYFNLGYLYWETQRQEEAGKLLEKGFSLAKRHPQDGFCARIIEMLKPMFDGE